MLLATARLRAITQIHRAVCGEEQGRTPNSLPAQIAASCRLSQWGKSEPELSRAPSAHRYPLGFSATAGPASASEAGAHLQEVNTLAGSPRVIVLGAGPHREAPGVPLSHLPARPAPLRGKGSTNRLFKWFVPSCFQTPSADEHKRLARVWERLRLQDCSQGLFGPESQGRTALCEQGRIGCDPPRPKLFAVIAVSQP